MNFRCYGKYKFYEKMNVKNIDILETYITKNGEPCYNRLSELSIEEVKEKLAEALEKNVKIEKILKGKKLY